MKRFQNKVAESSLSLPVSSVISVLIWFAAGLVSRNLWVPLLLTGFTTYLIAEMNNRNALLRIRSRMMSCVYLFLTTMQTTVVSSWQLSAVQTITVLCVFLLLFCYKDRGMVSNIFCISILLSAGSIMWVPLLYCLPVIVALLCIPLYAMSIKAISAVVMGLILPYWSLVPYFIYVGNTNWLSSHFTPLYDGSVFFNYTSVTVGQAVYFGFLILLLLIGWIHFVRTSYKDKLKTRTLYDVFITLAVFFAVMTLIVPAHADFTLSMLSIAVTPIAAHYFSLTNTKLTNAVFVIALVLVVAASLFAIATPYFEMLILR